MTRRVTRYDGRGPRERPPEPRPPEVKPRPEPEPAVDDEWFVVEDRPDDAEEA